MKKMMVIGGVCAFVMGVSAAEFTFAPNVEPKPVTMSVESNTLVRLDRDQTVTIACAEGSERASRMVPPHKDGLALPLGQRAARRGRAGGIRGRAGRGRRRGV